MDRSQFSYACPPPSNQLMFSRLPPLRQFFPRCSDILLSLILRLSCAGMDSSQFSYACRFTLADVYGNVVADSSSALSVTSSLNGTCQTPLMDSPGPYQVIQRHLQILKTEDRGRYAGKSCPQA